MRPYLLHLSLSFLPQPPSLSTIHFFHLHYPRLSYVVMTFTLGQRLRLVTSFQPPPFALRFRVRRSRGGSWLHLPLGLWERFRAGGLLTPIFRRPLWYPLVSFTSPWWWWIGWWWCWLALGGGCFVF
ncbi:hypothetical protein GBA52_004536 [Prunus armeniaca]|nr:hypothetical protein GBA52_004536 [Prunus armeniaca]